MRDLKKLVEGYKSFLQESYQTYKKDYETLARDGQSPKIMIIACCDSRVNPDLIFHGKPGDLFVVRNVANLVPPFEQEGAYHGTSAAIEFAVNGLKVEHIIIMGHSQCGGIEACVNHTRDSSQESYFIENWAAIVRSAAEEILAENDAQDAQIIQDKTAMRAVCKSLENLESFPFVKQAIQDNRLKIHGAFFEIETAQLYALDKGQDEFIALD